MTLKVIAESLVASCSEVLFTCETQTHKKFSTSTMDKA